MEKIVKVEVEGRQLTFDEMRGCRNIGVCDDSGGKVMLLKSFVDLEQRNYDHPLVGGNVTGIRDNGEIYHSVYKDLRGWWDDEDFCFYRFDSSKEMIK